MLDTASVPVVVAPPARALRTTDLRRLRDVAAAFLGAPSGAVLLAAAGAALLARLVLARWSWIDLAVVAALLLVRPFAEWAGHRFLFHARPVRVGGRDRMLGVTRAHRAHHDAPVDMAHALTPLPVVLQAVGGVFILALAAPTWESRATAVTALLLVLLVTEATHLLLHSSWQPRSSSLQRLRRAHRLHHFRDEATRFGLTTTRVDSLLGTSGGAPDSR